jgi:hypothetical protein
LTPTDLSPARPFDVKLHSPYDHVAPVHGYLSHSSLLSENNSPIKSQEALTSNPIVSRSPLVQLNHSRHVHHVPTSNFPFFDSFSEAPPSERRTNGLQLNPASSHISQAPYNAMPQRRMPADGRLPNMDWRTNSLLQQHQVHSPVLKANSDWRILNEKAVSDYSPTAVGGHGNEEPLRASFVYQQPPGAQSLQTTHEVRAFYRQTLPFMLIYALGNCL